MFCQSHEVESHGFSRPLYKRGPPASLDGLVRSAINLGLTLRLTAEGDKNLSALSGVACEKWAAIPTPILHPESIPNEPTTVRLGRRSTSRVNALRFLTAVASLFAILPSPRYEAATTGFATGSVGWATGANPFACIG